MRIYGPDHTNFNPYKQQMQKPTRDMKEAQKEDQLRISSQAQEMLENDKTFDSREAYVQKIKAAVDNGDYQIDHAKTARKMIDFWSGKS
ncbi:hypothetical protein GCM10028778_06140 [Barrientosiimonas marina]|uniref:Negative regulator of flagellin synthesis n=1 Tax=Lentibacillus kimchii TaxID=1542911 RepID=A0ABW2UV60_9BACI